MKNMIKKSLQSLRVSAISLLLLASIQVTAATIASACSEAGYTQVYGLDIDNTNLHSSVPYSINNAASIATGSFDRIAYQVELQKPGETSECVWVSMDAFTQDASLIGVPSFAGSNTSFQQTLSNMNVISTKLGIVTGVGIATGNIEFWPYNYRTSNANGVPSASNGLFDTGDSNGRGSSYGSMQIHNHGANQTLFALNHFSGSTNKDLGIGNRESSHPDWTFSGNSGQYTTKSINIYVSATPTPLAEYQFDELSWNGTSDEVTDNSGNDYHGTATGMTTTIAGKICGAGDFTNTGIDDYLTLDNNALDGQTDFSISVWTNTTPVATVALLSGANSSRNNELLFWFDGANNMQPFIRNSSQTSLADGNFDDGTWRHLVWTRSGAQHCLYVDGALSQCANGSNIGALNIEPGGLIVGKEQDTVGDNFDPSQAWDGLLDELVIFDSVLTSTEIQIIYANQDAGNNYDGSARTCPIPTVTPVLEYRFDECSYTGLGADVVDQIGNPNGSANGVPDPIDAAVINKALDLSANNTSDWLNVPIDAVDGLDDFSVSVWFKTSVDKPQQQIFHALGNDPSDDELEIHLKDNDTVVIKVRDDAQELISNIVFDDGNWHHLVLTRVGKDVCLFIDGEDQECDNGVRNGKLSITNANAIVFGQEQDSFGGGFSTTQNFVGQLDEFKIYDVRLSDTDIDRIFLNESAGNNYDDSPRDAVQCDNICFATPGVLNAVGIKIGGGVGFDTQINTTTEALDIYAAWLAAGSNFSGSINTPTKTYNVTASGSNTVDRIDFGGSGRDFSGTLAYPGAADGVGGSDFLVHTSGTLSLPAGWLVLHFQNLQLQNSY